MADIDYSDFGQYLEDARKYPENDGFKDYQLRQAWEEEFGQMKPPSIGDTVMRGMRNTENAMSAGLLHLGAITPEKFSQEVAENAAINQSIPQDKNKLKLINDIATSTGFWDGALKVVSNPAGVGRLTAEQVGNMIPSMALGATGAAIGSKVPIVGTGIGFIAGMASGSLMLETGMEVLSQLDKENVDITDPVKIQEALTPEFMSNALERGAIRGATIAAIDVATMGVGGLMLNSAGKKLARTLTKEGVDITSDTAVKAALAGSNKSIMKAAEGYAKSKTLKGGIAPKAGAFALESAGEPAGEALAQFAVGDEIDTTEVVLEGVGGLGASAFTTGAQSVIGAPKQIKKLGGLFANKDGEQTINPASEEEIITAQADLEEKIVADSAKTTQQQATDINNEVTRKVDKAVADVAESGGDALDQALVETTVSSQYDDIKARANQVATDNKERLRQTIERRQLKPDTASVLDYSANNIPLTQSQSRQEKTPQIRKEQIATKTLREQVNEVKNAQANEQSTTQNDGEVSKQDASQVSRQDGNNNSISGEASLGNKPNENKAPQLDNKQSIDPKELVKERIAARDEKRKQVNEAGDLSADIPPPRLNTGVVAESEFKPSVYSELTQEDKISIAESWGSQLQEGGGISYLQDENGNVNGRTKSINPEWFKDGSLGVMNVAGDDVLSNQPSVRRVQATISKLKKGENLTKSEERIIEALVEVDNNHYQEGSEQSARNEQESIDSSYDGVNVDAIDETIDSLIEEGILTEDMLLTMSAEEVDAAERENYEQEKAKQDGVNGEVSVVPEKEEDSGNQEEANGINEESILTDYSQDDLNAKQEAEDRQATEKAASDKKADIDADVDNFELTGSDRSADASTGQSDVFSEQVKKGGVANEDEINKVVADNDEIIANQNQEKLEDFGEKLGGARKDTAVAIGALKDLGDDDISTQPLSKTFPKSLIDKEEDAGRAAIMQVFREAIPNKPRTKHKVKRWAEKVKTFLELTVEMTNLKSTEEVVERMRSPIYASALSDSADKIELLMSVDRGNWGRIGKINNYSKAYRYGGDGKDRIPSPSFYVQIDGKTEKVDGAKKIQDVFEFVQEKLSEGSPDSKQLMKFEIRGRKGAYFINKTGDRERHHLKSFTDLAEARLYLKNNNAELVAEWEKVKEKFNVKKSDMRSKTNKPRTGKDYRKGKDITTEEFSEAFGFRGVEFGNWVKQGKKGKERQGFLNQTYDGLMDLADMIGVPPKAISLNGSLGIGFGSRGRGGSAAAHFEPSGIVINLTKPSGAGSLAHEWFHALDNYFSRQRNGEVKVGNGFKAEDAYRKGNYVTYHPEPMMIHKEYGSSMTKAELKRRQKEHKESGYFSEDNWQVDPNHPEGIRPEVEVKFANLVEALDDSPMRLRSMKNDKNAEDGYWSRIIERAARSFENYVITKMENGGYNNDFLANVQGIESFMRDEGRYPYLLPEEIAPIENAFNGLFKTLKTKETEQGVALYSKSKGIENGLSTQQATNELNKDKRLAKAIESGLLKVVASADDLPSGAELFHTVWHGSPHDHNKFESSKIGTGEGAQAYGYGLYFAGKKAVAEHYRDALTGNRDSNIILDGQPLTHSRKMDERSDEAIGAFNAISRQGGVDAAIDWLIARNNHSDNANLNRQRSASINWINDNRDRLGYEATEGVVYQVDLAPSQDEYLLWGKPLSEQSQVVVDALEKKFSLPSFNEDFRTAGEFYRHRARNKGGQEKVSAELKELGIRGIKYLDGNSRGGGGGDYNYVIFDDADIEITAKYSKGEQVVQGASLNGVAYVVANGNTKADVRATAYHELTHNMMDSSDFLGSEQRSKLLKRLSNQRKINKNNSFWQSVEQRVKDAETAPEHVLDEVAGYAVTEYLNGNKNLPKGLVKWVQDFIAALKAAVFKYTGLQFGKVSPQELIAMTEAYVDKTTGKERDVQDAMNGVALASKEGRLKQLEAEGYDTQNPFTHESSDKDFNGVITKKSTYGVFDGIFSLQGEEGAAIGTGGYNHTYYIRKGALAGDSDSSLDYEKSKEFLEKAYPQLDEVQLDRLYDLTAADENIWDNENDNPLADYGYEDSAEASWEFQNIRGKIAVDQDFDAIAMDDENGTSYFIPFGSKAKHSKLKDSSNLLYSKESTSNQAHKTAQRNAALPVSEGGLGLPANNTAMDRAKAMGFDVDTIWYHGSDVDFNEFDRSFIEEESEGGFFFSKSREVSERNIFKESGKAEYVRGFFVKSNSPLITAPNEWQEGLRSPESIQSAHDSVLIEADNSTPENTDDVLVVFDPKNIRETRAVFDPMKKDEPDLLFSIKKETNGVGSYTDKDSTGFAIPDETWTKVAIRKMQDKFKVLKDLQANIIEAGGTISEKADAYVAEELFHGKAENDILNMRKKHVEPFADKLAATGISQKELDKYLRAMHAEERNDYIASINADRPDGGSGMKTKDANKIIEQVENSDKAADYKELADMVYAMLKERRRVILDGGLEDDGLIAAWESTYKNYVPLKGFADNEKVDPRPSTGKGFNIGGKESKRAMGRSSESASPSSYAIVDLTETLIRNRKNEVGNALLALIEDNPQSEYWNVYTDENPETKESILQVDGKDVVKEVAIPMSMMSDRYFTTKRDGKTYYMKIGDKNDTRIMDAMKNIGIDHSGKIIQTMGGITRIMSALNTSYSPEFIVGNFLRDVQTAVLNLQSEESSAEGKIKGKKIAKQTVKDIPIAMRAVYRSLDGKKSKTKEGREFQQWFEEFKESGAKTGWFDMKDLDGQTKELESLIAMSDGSVKGNMMKWGKSAANVVENMNSAVENAVRLSAYVNARRAGISKQKAASLAKNMTVNFNRKGEVGATLNAIYMFSNASIQGVANFARTMGTLKGDKSLKWQNLNNAQKIAVGMAAGAFFIAMANRAAAGEDDDGENWFDKVPDYVKERNIVIMKSLLGGRQDGSYWKIPLPYGYNIFNVLGDSMESIAFSDKSIGSSAGRLTLATLGSFSPIGFQDSNTVTGGILKNATPTVVKPIVDIALNENFFGSSIYTENFPFGTPKPDSSLGRRSTPEAYRKLASWLNESTGGSKYRSGAIDINPDVMRYVADYFGGAAYGFFGSKLPDSFHRGINGVELEVNRMPFVSRIAGKVMPYDDMGKFYERRDEVNQLKAEYETLNGVERSEFNKEYGKKMRLSLGIKAAEKKLKALRRKRDAIYADESMGFAQRDLKLKAIQLQMKRYIDRINKAYSNASKSQ